ncbi:helix-turn-helix domain-containing protein [Micromonospora sp. LOL_024]|uniref:helix-turn-helix domain-containing protein n=1 Tax=Micromonospora sp. LOL_024 TaxID=3345412 RepID=UPI003A84D682
MSGLHHPAGPVELPDGSVIVPADVAGELLAAAVRDLTARARRDGLAVSGRAVAVLQALHEAAVRHDTTSSGPGTPTATTPMVEISTHEAATLMGCSAEYVRRLCRSGVVIARRIGPAWLIDRPSLDRHRHRTEGP